MRRAKATVADGATAAPRPMSNATITSLARGLREWATRDGQRRFLHDEQLRQLQHALDTPGRRTQANVAAWMLGTYHLGHGFLRVFDGDAEGFDEARLGQSLRRASLLARMRGAAAPARGRRRKLPFSLLHGAWTVLLGLGLRDPDAEPLFELWLDLPDVMFGEQDTLPLFARELIALQRGRRVRVSSRLGPFQNVLQRFDGDPQQLARDLAELLDWHLAEARGGSSALDDPACRVYPFEVMAVRDVREWRELPMPRVEHPLMFTNLAQMEPRTPWPRDELVRRLMR